MAKRRDFWACAERCVPFNWIVIRIRFSSWRNRKGRLAIDGTTTCWGDDEAPSLATLADLAVTIKKRRMQPEAGSYTAKLFESGLARIAQKVGEEGVETALAGATQAPNLKDEAADLLYHLLVLLEASGASLDDVLKVLFERSRK